MGVFKYSSLDFFFTCLGLIFLLLDIVLDISAAVSFYQEKEYVYLGFLLLFLVGSSLLVQAFSFLWYSYENFERETKVEKCLSVSLLKFVHVLQLGIYFRHGGVVEVSIPWFSSESRDREGVAVYLSHDLSMLRLIETFSESSPQLVLMLTIMLQQGRHTDHVTVLKAVGSIMAIVFSVTTYHRALRSFLSDKNKQPMISLLFYFFWNLLLMASRITALALFASVLPCFIIAHFFCSWMVFFFWAWRCKTDFMDSHCGEWLYRATVGLIWYFNWFNVVSGRTRNRSLLYHVLILADMFLLCGLWSWKTIEQTNSHLIAIVVAVSVVAVYILGLFFKIIYYKCFHPNLTKEVKGDPIEMPGTEQVPSIMLSEDVTDFPGNRLEDKDEDISFRSGRRKSLPAPKRCNKRMRMLAENFYS